LDAYCQDALIPLVETRSLNEGTKFGDA
jgi:hypothetical protein